MDPITIGLLMSLPSLIQGGAQFFQGIKDKKEADAIREAAGDRPEYQVPESVGKMVSMYQQLAQGGMPGESMLKEDIQASTARTAGTAAQLADSPVAALTALGGAQQRELGALRDLQVRASQYQAQQRQNLAQAYGQQAQYENLAWDWNKGRKWQEAQNEYWNMRQSGQANMWGGVDTAMSGIQRGIGAGMQASMFNQMYPDMGGAGASAQGGGFNPNPFMYQYQVPQNPMTPPDTESYNNMFGQTLPGQPNNYNWNQ